MIRKVLLILLSIFSSMNIQAQMGKMFNADNQLSSNYAHQVFQDQDGFIWVATRNGLNRYDGYQFHIFKKEENTGMSSNYINCITQDKKGTIYIGNVYTVQRYDGARFHDFDLKGSDGQSVRTYITRIVETKSGNLLVCTSGFGIMKLDLSNDTGSRMENIPDNLNYVRDLLEDDKGRLWIVSENDGLTLIDGKKHSTFFNDNVLKSRLSEIKQDKEGHIYLAVQGKGIYCYDEKQHNFAFEEKTSGLPVTTFCITNSGHMLLGCDGCGIMRYNPKTHQIENNPFYSRDINLTKTKVKSIIEDRHGNIWFCMFYKGLFMQPRAKMAFGYAGYRLGDQNTIGTNCVTSTLIDKSGHIWVGTDKDGLYLLDKNNIATKHYENVPSTILCLAEDVKGHIWIGSYGDGCGWLDVQTGVWHQSELGLGQGCSVFDLATAKNGDVWIATMGEGLININVLNGKQTTFRMENGSDTHRNRNSIPNNYLSKIFLTPDEKKLFIASSVGLCCYDIDKKSWISTFNGSNCPNYGTFSRDVYVDNKQRIWIGTNDGLYCYQLDKKTDSYYTISDGLPSNGIASITADLLGNLWIGTDKGLCCYNPEKNSFINYYVDNGLQSNEFSDGTVSMDADGSIFFGGTGGLSWFNPSELKPQMWKATVKLTGLIVGHNPVAPGTKSGIYTITDSDVINSKHFDLSFADNSFTIQLSTLTYDNPEHITYYYSINGEEWTRLQRGINEITFSHLSPGSYHFRVKASNNQQETDIREFTLRIHSPWYASFWAWLIYLTLIGLAIYMLVRYRQRKEQDHLRLQEHIHAEQMADAKLKFFMNISHEIRTPMTLIVTPLLSLMKKDNDPTRRSIYETIRRNAERILGLINQMMDMRKIDKGQMQMRMCETDLIEFVGDIYTLFAHQAKAKNINFTYEHDTDHLPIWIDRSNFDKVIVNIISNAFKFTPPGGNIRIDVAHDENNAKIIIYDDGEKIPEDKLNRIFDRFYQLPTATNDRNMGTGIGLDLTRSLVELHHGQIEAHNNDEGKGCQFTVTLPLGNEHLIADEMIAEGQEPVQTSALLEESHEDIEETTPVLKMKQQQSIVIAEDDDEIREFLISQLKDEFDVTGCINGLEALKEIAKKKPDLVISDIMMPELDGNTLCSKIKSNPNTSDMPVILLTAKNRDEDQLEGLETGADAYIVKPFNMDILKRTIVNLINTHQMLRLKYGRNDRLEEKVDNVNMKSPDEKLLERVMSVINKNLDNSDLSVDRIADEVGISRVHLHRKMKELTGQTPHDFIRNIRLKQAAHLLTNQNMNITEVMYACGFNNSASFSTIFKKFYGLSPRDYMKEHNKKSSMMSNN